MNIYISPLSNTIILSRVFSKKNPPFYEEYSFTYSLKRFDNKVKALNELLTADVVKLFENETSNSLILSDDVVFHGTTSVPSFSASKTIDAFKTKVKINFPNITDYYISYSLGEKNSSSSLVNYALVQTRQSKGLVDVFEHHNIKIKNVNYFGNLYKQAFEKDMYPRIALIIGKKASELIVSKGKTILGVSTINIGSEELLDTTKLNLSTYNKENDISLRYASFHKTNFDSKDLLTDEMILKYPISKDYEISLPKEARILKDETLENYIKKQNFLRFHCRVLDILDIYKEEPYYIPLNEINVYSTDELFENLCAANNIENIKYIKANDDLKKLFEVNVPHNSLFDTQLITKERKKIEWSKILTMEIGKKKKA